MTVPEPTGVAHVPSPRQNVVLDADVPLLRFATARLPVTPVDNGRPVALVNTRAVGVPSAGVTSVGEVASTAEPVPVTALTVVPFILKVLPDPAVSYVLFVSVSVVALPTNVSVAVGSVNEPDAVAETMREVVPDVAPATASVPACDPATPIVNVPLETDKFVLLDTAAPVVA